MSDVVRGYVILNELQGGPVFNVSREPYGEDYGDEGPWPTEKRVIVLPISEDGTKAGPVEHWMVEWLEILGSNVSETSDIRRANLEKIANALAKLFQEAQPEDPR